MAEFSDREIKTIRSSELFSALTENRIRELISPAAKISFRAYEVIYRPKTAANFIFVILTGHVKIYEMAKGQAEKNMRVLGPGQSFGEEEFKASQEYSSYAEAVDNVMLLIVDSDMFDEIIQANIQKVAGLVNGLAEKLQELADLSEFQQLEINLAALATVIQEEFVNAGNRVFTLSVTMDQLAEKIGITPEALDEVVHELGELGVVEIIGLEVTVLDEEILRNLAGLD